MKKITLALLVIAMAAISSCKKDDNKTSTPSGGGSNATKTQLITAKKWKVTAATLSGQDFYSQLDECNKDDIHEFKANYVYIYDEGATKCDPSDPQNISTATWKFTDNETKLEFDGEVAEIKELSSGKMVLEGVFAGAKVVTTYTAQ